jgi:asparagine synthase (glutamine-hydrolysing)
MTGYVLLRADEAGRADSALESLGGAVERHGPLAVIASGRADRCRATDPASRLTVWFDGLLFNRESLAGQLKLEENPSAGRLTDAELVLAAYLAFGRQAFERLSGQFAIVLVDPARSDCLLVRDQLGARTLHYAQDGGILWFSTGFRPLISLMGRPRVNLRALLEFTLHGDVLPPGSLFDGVKTLPQGHWLVVEDGSSEPTVERFHDLLDTVSEAVYRRLLEGSADALLDALDGHFHRSIRENLGGADTCAVGLSGGVDSALVTAIASRYAKVHAINLSVPQGREFDERPMAERVANLVGVPLTVITMDGGLYRSELAAATYANEMPLWHLQNLGLYLVARRALELGAGCMMTGDTSGMLLTGHNHEPWRDLRRGLALLARVPPSATAFLRKLGHAAAGLPLDSHGFPWAQPLATQLIDGYGRSELQRCAEGAYGFLGDTFERRVLSGRLAEVRQWYNRFYYRGDRLATAQGVGFRSPFGDLESLRFGMNIPQAFLTRNGAPKWSIKELGSRYVTREVAYQKKVAWRMPVGLYLKPFATPRFFEDGFCAETFGLSRGAISANLPAWLANDQQLGRMVHIEVWGRLFARGESLDQVSAWLASFESR